MPKITIPKSRWWENKVTRNTKIYNLKPKLIQMIYSLLKKMKKKIPWRIKSQNLQTTK